MFNQQRYEHIYGIDALDTAHNFFPEMMYDSHLFPQPMLAWMRHRMSSLFPSEYAQQNTLYRLYHSQQRAQMMEVWRNQSSPPTNTWHPPSPIRQEPVPTDTHPPSGTATATTPLRQTMAQHLQSLQTPPQLSRTTTRRGNEFIPASQLLQPLNTSDLTLLNSLLNTGGTTQTNVTNQFTNFLGELNYIFDDVIVAPTAQHIANGSQIIEHSAVPEDINCAICQERGEPRNWRLLYCHHYFHTNCISRWYEQSVECPVCRADIRTPTAPTTTSVPMPVRTAPPPPTQPTS